MSRPADPRERLRANLVGIVSTLVTGIWLAALLAGFEWWLPALIVGYVVVVPITAMLFGDEEEGDEWAGDVANEAPGREAGREDATESDDADDALQALRERYARGDLTDEQFERKLERLLETETVEDAARTRSGEPTVADAPEDVEDRLAKEQARVRDRDLERER